MARFPHYKKNVSALGKLLANARMNSRQREDLMRDPNKVLADLGLPVNVTQLMTFKVIDEAMKKAVVLPYKLNSNKLENNDPEYLNGVANLFTH